MTTQVLIVGCGDTGRHVAKQMLATGANVQGLVRSADSAKHIAELGVTPIQADLDAGAFTPPPADYIFYFAPPPRDGETDPRLSGFLNSLGQHSLQRLVYISTSGVYGDCAGAWVNEATPVNPQSARAVRRVAAEKSLQAWDGPWVILRAPGIYGPGRIPVEKVKAGEPVLQDDDCGWSNRIHIDDLAQTAVHAATRGPDRQIYNVTDGNPTKMAAYYGAVAELLGLPAPRQISWAQAEQEFSAMRLSFLKESRRVDSRRVLEKLQMQLRYPKLIEGLKACL